MVAVAAQLEVSDCGRAPVDERQDYIPLMLDALGEQRLGLRRLALRTGIGKSRLGLLLHRDPGKRSVMTLAEFQRILTALDIDMIEAVVTVEVLRELGPGETQRHRALVAMLCAMFQDLPVNLITALEDIPDVDGTEVRAEWGPVLQRAVIKRLVHEIGAVVARRAAINELDIFH